MPYANKAEQLRYQRLWMRRRRRSYFETKSCVDCGATNNLELDHIDRRKKVSHKIWSWSEDRRNAELAKCQVRCHRCHKQRHREAGDLATMKGVTPTNAKLTPLVVRLIRRLRKSGLPNRRISGRLSIPRQTIDDIIAGRSWKRV